MKNTPKELIKNRMWKHHLFWIIPLCLIIGYLFGLYFNVPQNITIDYGDNILKVVETMDNINLSFENCPDCNCECMIKDEDVVCINPDEYIITRKRGLTVL